MDGATVLVSAGPDGLVVGGHLSASRRQPPDHAMLH